MIVAIACPHGDPGRTVLANNLAVLRARSGRKVCLVDTDPQRPSFMWGCARSAAGVRPPVPARALGGRSLPEDLAQMSERYHDILISTEARDTHDSRSALIAARLVLVPVQPGQVDLATQYKLIARLNCARMFNPGLRVLFVVVGGADGPDAAELAAVRAYASRVMSATLAATVIHTPCLHACGQGRCVCDADTCDPAMAAEMQALYHEVYPH
ncbi:cobyrinic acid ac-diamide synthase [Massilia atriviolacea]|uniref:Cobyrinic acid ac-diamide synthase n=1 Tax=Massilia atriviolacea TaxID=2495579 RepID=A0A430HPH2_9BURK|nr:cobyrinic acid ac-diamide synthase [Massilia atriviolacea]RSZ59416.1 cobyrinic acid ac-diamide synthase [Massilia atriviolacea]